MATVEEYAQNLRDNSMKFHVSTNYYRDIFYTTDKRGIVVGIEFTDYYDISEHKSGAATYNNLPIFGEVREWNVLADKWLLYEVVASFSSKEDMENYVLQQGDERKYHCAHIDDFTIKFS